MSFVSFPHLVYIVYQIFWEKSNFFGERFWEEKEDAEVGGNAACLDYPRIMVFYRSATPWYSFHRGRQHGEVFDAILHEAGRNCYINFSGRGATGQSRTS